MQLTQSGHTGPRLDSGLQAQRVRAHHTGECEQTQVLDGIISQQDTMYYTLKDRTYQRT